MTRTLDKNRPYGQIFGILENGAVFEQDGCQFNGQGECVYEPEDAPAPPKPVAEEDKPSEGEVQDRREKLEALHATAIKKLVEDEGLKPASGAGSKARNIEMLLAGG